MQVNEYSGSHDKINRGKIFEDTISYMKNYLDPKEKWRDEIHPRTRINLITQARVNWEVIADCNRSLNYQDFLRTPYWKAISAHVKFKAGYRCQECKSYDRLETHHENYSIRGYEHAHIHQLTALCKDCHNRQHGHRRVYYNNHSDHTNLSLYLFLFFVIIALLCFYSLRTNSLIDDRSSNSSNVKLSAPIAHIEPVAKLYSSNEAEPIITQAIRKNHSVAREASTFKCDTRKDSRD